MVRNRTGAGTGTSIRTGSRLLAPWPQKRRLKLDCGVPEGSLDNPEGRAVLMKTSSRDVGGYAIFAEAAAGIEARMPLVRHVLGMAKAQAGMPKARPVPVNHSACMGNRRAGGAQCAHAPAAARGVVRFRMKLDCAMAT